MNCDTNYNEDKGIELFLKSKGMFVEGQYERPEIKIVKPTHLVRSGNTSAADAYFGLKVGGAAVQLLLNDYTNVSVTRVADGIIEYMPIQEAIKQRPVSLDEIAMFEQQGVFFGRTPGKYTPKEIRMVHPDIRYV
ncbi:hypothetical protein JXC34_03880 [Candidatus Woesearchaeota archaeon]|nr:hypothetical protein [Candidatus Woesearchaeota archaeon]